MPAAPALSGELGLLSLFDLGQLFLLNGATGELCVVRDGRKGYLYFDRGQIVNAVDDEYHEGDGAAYRLFTWKSGAFEFRAQAPTGARAVSEGTEALMLEAARRMDELGLGDAGEEAKLKQRAGALDALREAFQSVAVEAGAGDAAAGAAAALPLARLAGPDDALLLRPGRRPRLRAAGAWADASGEALDPAAYEQWRARWFETAASGDAEAGEPARTCVSAGDDGRRYVVARLAGENEALWVRLADATPPALASLPGGEAIAAQLAGTAGLLVVAAPEAAAADAFFHACVAHLAATRGDTLLLVAAPGRWSVGDGAGAVARAGAREAGAALLACAPGCAAYDTAHAGHSAGALGAVPLVVSCVVASEPGAALAAWRARAVVEAGDGFEPLLERAGATIVFASSTAADARLVLVRDEPIPRSATRPHTKRAA